jgi:hypothetical protein
MSQPGLEQEAPRGAEIYRTIQDFRSEFREAMKSVVRQDVYAAHMATMQLRIDNQDAKINSLKAEHEAEEKDRKAIRNIAIGIGVPGVLSLLIAIVGWLVK